MSRFVLKKDYLRNFFFSNLNWKKNAAKIHRMLMEMSLRWLMNYADTCSGFIDIELNWTLKNEVGLNAIQLWRSLHSEWMPNRWNLWIFKCNFTTSKVVLKYGSALVGLLRKSRSWSSFFEHKDCVIWKKSINSQENLCFNNPFTLHNGASAN